MKRPGQHINALWAVAVIATAGVFGGAGHAQQSTAETDAPDEVFFGAVDVRVVNVEVFVTDKDDRPITGLTRDDFEVFEDGRPVEIDHFYAVEDRRPVPARETPSERVREGLPEQLAELPEDQRLHLVVYVDNFNLRPENRRWVLRGVRDFLQNRISPEDRMMLVSYDRELKIRTAFTPDPMELLAALDQVDLLTGHSAGREAERRRVLQAIDRATSALSAVGDVRGYANFVSHEMSFGLDALSRMVRSLAGIPGRKALLYVSDGIPLVPGQDLFIAIEQRFGATTGFNQSFTYDLSRRYQRIVSHANASGVTLYTLDARGLQTTGSAEDSLPNLERGMLAIDSARKENLQAPLRQLAYDTGGIPILNTNALRPNLGRVAQDFSNFYSLGYTPGRPGDGRYHDIEVKVKRKGVRVRHRQGYRDKPRDTRWMEASEASMRYGFESNPLGAEVSFGAPTRREENRFVVPVEVRIPLSTITLIPGEDRHQGKLALVVGVIDERGDTSPLQRQEPATIVVAPDELETALEKHFTYEIQLLLAGGPQKVTVSVRDEYGSESSFLIRGIDPLRLQSAG